MRVFDCAFFKRILLRHDTGLGESYMAGEFEVRQRMCSQKNLHCRAPETVESMNDTV